MSTTTDRNLAAEIRAVEEGHHARLDRDARGPFLRVVSDTRPGKWYRVSVVAAAGEGQPLSVTCEPAGALDGDDHGLVSNTDGTLPCKHAAVAVRRLERAGLARYDRVSIDRAASRARASRWVSTAPAEAPAATTEYHRYEVWHQADSAGWTGPHAADASDPFVGFPQ